MTSFNLTTATPKEVSTHAAKAVRAQGKQASNLHADLRHLVNGNHTSTIEGLVSEFAKELQADKDSCAKKNKTLRDSITSKLTRGELSGKELKAAIKVEFEASDKRLIPCYNNWDVLRRAVERAYSKENIKAKVSTKGTIETAPKEEKKEAAPKANTSELLDTAGLSDRILADMAALVEVDLAASKAIMTAINNMVNIASDQLKASRAA